jgi:hypothetical protein
MDGEPMSIALVISLLKRFWWSIPMLGLLIALGVTRHSLASTKRDLAACNKHGAEVQAAYDQFAADVRAKTAQAKAADAAHAAAVLAQQKSISERTVDDYKAQIAAVRERAARIVRSGSNAPATNSSSGGNPRVPSSSQGAGRTDGATPEDRLSDSDALIATEQAIQLQALQQWVREQEGVR